MNAGGRGEVGKFGIEISQELGLQLILFGGLQGYRRLFIPECKNGILDPPSRDCGGCDTKALKDEGVLVVVEDGILKRIAEVLRAKTGVLEVELLKGQGGDIEPAKDNLDLVGVKAATVILDLSCKVGFSLVDGVMAIGEGEDHVVCTVGVS